MIGRVWNCAIACVGLLMSGATARAQDFSPDSVVRFDGNITKFKSADKGEAHPLKGQKEFALLVMDLTDDSYDCGFDEDFVEQAVLRFAKGAPFKLVDQNRHPLLMVEIITERINGNYVSQLILKASYTIHVVLPNQTEPWFAHVALWDSVGAVVGNEDPKKHLTDVMAMLQQRVTAFVDEWKYDNQ